MKKIISTNNMNTRDLKNLTKSQLIRLLIKQNLEIKELLQQNKNKFKPVPKPRTTKPVPFPRKSVKQMVQDYEDNIILPPPEFRDDYKSVPKPRTMKPIPKPRTMKPIPKPRTKKPVPLPRTKIEQVAKALKGFTKS